MSKVGAWPWFAILLCMKRFLKGAFSLMSLAAVAVLGSFGLWHASGDVSALQCTSPEQNGDTQAQKDSDERVYYVGCGGLF